MKRFLSLTIALFILSGVSAQQNTLTYQLDMQDPITVPVMLSGPDPSCLTVPFLLNVTYEPVEEMITVEVKYDKDKNDQYVKPPKKKDQITHLWFPLKWHDVQYKFVGYKRYFQDNFSSKVVQEPPMREQIANSGSSDLIRPAFQFINGELQNPMNEDIMLTVQGGRKIVMKVHVSDIDNPVVMKINNVIPLRAKYEYSMESNKFFLKYISNSCSITFYLPEDDCAKLYEYIEQYKQWNKELNDELSAMFKLDPQKDKTEIIRRKLLMYYNYKDVRRNLRETKCDMLRQEFDAFRRNYDDYISKGLITLDSLERIQDELDDLLDSAYTENNLGHCKKCNELKRKAEKFNTLELDEHAYNDISEAYDYVGRINERIKDMNNLKCCGGGGGQVVVSTPPVSSNRGRCQFDVERMKKAMRDINRLWSDNYLNGVKNRGEFDRIRTDTDNYLKSLPESCKGDNKRVIDSYNSAIQKYLENYK